MHSALIGLLKCNWARFVLVTRILMYFPCGDGCTWCSACKEVLCFDARVIQQLLPASGEPDAPKDA